MPRQRLTIASSVFGVGCAGLAAALLGFQADSAAGQVQSPSGATATIVTVTAGKPTEFAFKVSKSSSITPGVVTFKVTNEGALTHTFKICTSVVTSAVKNACVGRVTPVLKPGKTATLTITLAKGAYEYLGTETDDAVDGMKGLVGIGVTVTQPARPTTKPKTSTVAKTITAPTSTAVTTTTAVPLIGDPVNGALVYHSAGCDTCHHLNGAGPNSIDGANLDATVLATEAGDIAEVTNGDTFMPAFATTLSASQINDVSAYVYVSQHR
jgi:mono/diheme cytochrome c family protein